MLCYTLACLRAGVSIQAKVTLQRKPTKRVHPFFPIASPEVRLTRARSCRLAKGAGRGRWFQEGTRWWTSTGRCGQSPWRRTSNPLSPAWNYEQQKRLSKKHKVAQGILIVMSAVSMLLNSYTLAVVDIWTKNSGVCKSNIYSFSFDNLHYVNVIVEHPFILKTNNWLVIHLRMGKVPFKCRSAVSSCGVSLILTLKSASSALRWSAM